LETGYPVYPVMPTPIVEPAATDYPEEEVQYEDMEGTVYIACEAKKYGKDRKCLNSIPLCFFVLKR